LRQRASQGSINRSDFFGRNLLAKPRLGPLARFFRLRLVDAFGRHRHIGHDVYSIGRYFNESPAYGQKGIAAAFPYNYFPGHHLRHQPHMIGIDSHLALDSGQRNDLHVFGVSWALRRYDLKS